MGVPSVAMLERAISEAADGIKSQAGTIVAGGER